MVNEARVSGIDQPNLRASSCAVLIAIEIGIIARRRSLFRQSSDHIVRFHAGNTQQRQSHGSDHVQQRLHL